MSAIIFKVIGSDGREYPAEGLDELRSWAADGRVGRETLVWSPEDDRWRRAAERPELRWDLPEAPPVLDPASPRQPWPAGPASPVSGTGTTAGTADAAGILPRLAAGAMDLVTVLLLLNLALAPWSEELRSMQAAATAEAGKATPDLGLLLRFNALLLGPLLLLRMLYTAAFHAAVGATPGKLAFGLRLVALDGRAPGPGRVLLRTLLETLTLATLGLGFGVMMLAGDGRALHDLLAGTRVVRRSP